LQPARMKTWMAGTSPAMTIRSGSRSWVKFTGALQRCKVRDAEDPPAIEPGIKGLPPGPVMKE
jgi:hypothetical protein